MQVVREFGPRHGVAPTCQALGLSRATYYRKLHPKLSPKVRESVRTLSVEERSEVLGVLHELRFADLSPAEVYATLLDEGRYLCSERTMYRLLAANQAVRERRDVLRHPNYAAPELLATCPNELWSWDITKLLGPAKWTYYYLYVILDIFSRYVVAWMVAYREFGSLAKRLIEEACRLERIRPGQLTIHGDRGGPMISKPVAFLMADLGITKTHSRPHVSNDNPYSESHFKTMKYRPEFPDRFGSIQHARSVCGDLFRWYNKEHRHAGLAMLTPYDVHHGLAEMRIAQRDQVLARAYAAKPERFVRGVPKPALPPKEVWINKPKQEDQPDDLDRIVRDIELKNDAQGSPRSDDLRRGMDLTTPSSEALQLVQVVQ